jgi:two-component sensor histidine kinase
MLAGVVQDITERKLAEDGIRKSLDEKEILLKEVHHRVKNNLQMISSLLHLQSFLAKGKAHDMLRDSQNRIRSLSLVHEILYQSKDFSNISSKQYFTELMKRIMASYTSKKITTDIEVEDVPIKINTAITCGLITNELVINSIKHAFKESSGKISLYFNQNKDNNILTVKDDGIGISKGFSFDNTHSLGLKLVKSFTEQLEGKMDFYCDSGTTFKITFPKR